MESNRPACPLPLAGLVGVQVETVAQELLARLVLQVKDSKAETLQMQVAKPQAAVAGLAKRALLVQMTVGLTLHLGLTPKVGQASPLQSEVRLSTAQAEAEAIGGGQVQQLMPDHKAVTAAEDTELTQTEVYLQLMGGQTLEAA